MVVHGIVNREGKLSVTGDTVNGWSEVALVELDDIWEYVDITSCFDVGLILR